jgi:hypothetical protein
MFGLAEKAQIRQPFLFGFVIAAAASFVIPSKPLGGNLKKDGIPSIQNEGMTNVKNKK